MGYPCTPWCVFNYLINYKDHPEILAAIQETDRPLLKLVLWTAKAQDEGGRYYLVENPPTASSWKQAEITNITKRPNNYIAIGDQCMNGLTGRRGGLMKKQLKFAVNDEELAIELDDKCDNQQDHEVCEGGGAGGDTRLSQE